MLGSVLSPFDGPGDSIQAHFLSLPSYRRFPPDDEFHREIQIRDLYHFRNRSYWLRRLENHDRKERVNVDEYTIEHIMPQNPDLSAEWKADLGLEWQQVHTTLLHTLGNLTLTGYNAELSDRRFAEKKSMKGGFVESPLRMNQGLGSLPTLNREAILRLVGTASGPARRPRRWSQADRLGPQHVANTQADLALMDQQLVWCDSAGTPMEVCDLLSRPAFPDTMTPGAQTRSTSCGTPSRSSRSPSSPPPSARKRRSRPSTQAE